MRAQQPFTITKAEQPTPISTPPDYKERLKKARGGLMKQHRRERDPDKKELLKNIIALNDLLVKHVL